VQNVMAISLGTDCKHNKPTIAEANRANNCPEGNLIIGLDDTSDWGLGSMFVMIWTNV
jgi:hypothetical protein